MNKSPDDKAYEMSDLIYFAIKATRAEGEEKIKALRQLKQLAKAELEFEKAKYSDGPTRIFRRK
jgi:hypothetical protein